MIDLNAMKKLEKLRQDLGLSYAKFAEYLGYTGSNPARMVQRWCAGATPSSTNIRKIVDATKGKLEPNDFF